MKVNRRELLKNAAFVSGAALVGASCPSSRKLFAQDVLLNLPSLPSPENSGIFSPSFLFTVHTRGASLGGS